MASVKENRISLDEQGAREKVLEGAKEVFDNVSVSYGPKGKNVIIEQAFGRPVVTRDGITIARATFFSDRPKNVGAQAIIEASETTNRIVGDASSATVVLGYNLLENAHQSLAAGLHPMDVSALIKQDRDLLLSKLDTLHREVGKGELEHVATVSSGNLLIGKMIADAVERVGNDGGIIAEKAPINNVECEYVDGYYLQAGFNALQSGKKELNDPLVVVTIRPLRSRADAIELVNNVAGAVQIEPGQPLRLLLIGNIEGDAMASIIDGVNRGLLDAIVLTPPPSFGSMAKELLEDIALYAHTKPITELTPMRYSKEDAQKFQEYIGQVSRVVSTKIESTLFGLGDTDDIDRRVADLKEQSKVEISDHANERLKDRIAKLKGKIALFRIGAPTDSAKEELEFRVEDAINATRAAAKHGVVAGGGTTLLELSKTEGLSDITIKALQATFKQLLVNANLPAEIKLSEALQSSYGWGYDLRNGDELVDMLKVGVIDPKLAPEQTIINATDVVANVITMGRLLVFDDDKKE